MTAYHDDAALMADLMHGRMGRIATTNRALSADEARQLDEVIDHLRAQIISQTAELRAWRTRHAGLKTKIGRHYSACEGLFSRHHLRLYWILYRDAVRDRSGVSAGENKKPRLWAT